MRKESTDTEEEMVEDLVMAMLAVNQWSLNDTFALHESLRAEGLFDMQRLVAMDMPEIVKRLTRAGYSRGDFLVMQLSDRLKDLAKVLTSSNEHTLRSLSNPEHTTELEKFLLTINGIGPKVVRDYKLLRNL